MADHGTFYWNELSTTDIEAAKKFYAKLAGWRFNEMPMDNGGTYYVAMLGEVPAGGIMGMPEGAPDGTPPYWRAYISVDDIDSVMVQAKAEGAEVLMEAFDVPGVGRIGTMRDPQGAEISFMTPAAQE
ncbi:MAG: VOC family protein [Alphaproteobacteria bacterium]